MREISIDQTLTQYTGGYYLDKDFLLFDRVGELPFPDESARTTCLLLAICTAGKIEYTVDTKLHEVGPGDIIIVSEGQVVGDYNLSPDCEGVAWMISTDFFQDIVMGIQACLPCFSLPVPIPCSISTALRRRKFLTMSFKSSARYSTLGTVSAANWSAPFSRCLFMI